MHATARRLRAAPPVHDLPVWPSADLWPMLPTADLEALRADIVKRGLVNPLVTYVDGVGVEWLLDGRNRRAALAGTDLTPAVRRYEGDDPDGEVLSVNLQRRHLNVSQRALIYAMTVTTKNGRPSETGSIEPVSSESAAAASGIGQSRIKDARYLIEHKHAEFIADIAAGVGSVSALAKIARHRDKEAHEQALRDAEAAAAVAEADAEAAAEAALELVADSAAAAARIADIDVYAPDLLPESYTRDDWPTIFERFDTRTEQSRQAYGGVRDEDLPNLVKAARNIAAVVHDDASRLVVWSGLRLKSAAVADAADLARKAADALTNLHQHLTGDAE